MKRWPFLILCLLCVCCGLWWWFWCRGPVTTIIVIRHAEKALEDGTALGPPLSAAGQARAQELAHVLEDSGVSAIFTTQFLRTQQTAQPLASQESITPTSIGADDVPTLVDGILSDHRGHVVVVVGHTNTVPQIIQALGGGVVPAIDEDEFDNMFVVTRRPFANRTLRLRYGGAS